MKAEKLITEGAILELSEAEIMSARGRGIRIDFRVRVIKGKKHEAPSLQLKSSRGTKNVQLRSNDNKDWYGWATIKAGTRFDIRCWCLVNKGGSMTLSAKEPNYPIWSRKDTPNNGKCIIEIPNYVIGQFRNLCTFQMQPSYKHWSTISNFLLV